MTRFVGLFLAPYFANICVSELDWNTADVVHHFLREGQTLSKGECKMLANEEVDLASGERGTTFIQGSHLFISTPSGHLVASADRTWISSWLAEKFPSVFAAPVELAHHSDPACLESVMFYPVVDLSLFSQGLSKDSKDIVHVVIPVLLRAMESLHSVGLMVPWNELGLTEDGKVRLISKSLVSPIPWTPFVDFEEREYLSNPSRAVDLLMLFRLLSSQGEMPDLPEWKFTLERFRKYTEDLSRTEIPDYGKWIGTFAGLKISRHGDRLASLDINDLQGFCRVAQDDWGQLIESVSEETWEALGGAKLVAVVPRMEDDPDCQIALMRLLRDMLASIARSSNPPDLALFVHRAFKEWDSSRFCDANRNQIELMFDDTLESVHFNWVFCPSLFRSSRRSQTMDRDLRAISELKLQITKESLRLLLPGLEIPRMMTMSSAKDDRSKLLNISSGLLLLAGVDVHELAGFITNVYTPVDVNFICSVYKPMAKSLVETDLEQIYFMWVCDPPTTDDKLCSVVKDSGGANIGGSKSVMRPLSRFNIAGLRDFASLVTKDDVSDSCKANAWSITMRYLRHWMYSFVDEEGGRVLPHQFRDLIPAIGAMCNTNLRQLTSSSSSVTALFTAWLCQNPSDFLSFKINSRSASDFLNYCFVPDALGVDEWAAEIQGSRLLKSPDSCLGEGRIERMAQYVIEILGDSRISPEVILRLADRQEFCWKYKRYLKSYPKDIAKVCPVSAAEIRHQIAPIKANRGNGRLNVRRSHAFSDSISLLSSPFVNSEKPGGVGFVGEQGVDGGGITREWFSVLGQQIAGSLFVQKPGASYYIVDHSRVQSAEDRKAWFSFGRLMALALVKSEQIGIPLPMYFFARFLKGRVDEEDYQPEIADTINAYRRILTLPPSAFGYTPAWLLSFPELGEEEIEVTFANRDEVIGRAIASYSSGPDDLAFEHMRAGFAGVLDFQEIREHISAAEMKRLISGDDTLDVAKLKSLAVKADNVPIRRFNMLFEWL